MKIGYLTDRGMRRPKNEDAIKLVSDKNFFMLADGVGGNKSGEIASDSALEALEKFVQENSLEILNDKNDIFKFFQEAVNFVNQYIIVLASSDPKYLGMATTLVFVYVRDNHMYVANIGDSRVYVSSNSKLYQITEDHTYVNDLVRMGAISKEEASRHHKKNVITKAIGVNSYIKPDCFSVELTPESRVLICSDGLYAEVGEEKILSTLNRYENMQRCAEDLVGQANRNGGNDNISVICIKMED